MLNVGYSIVATLVSIILAGFSSSVAGEISDGSPAEPPVVEVAQADEMFIQTDFPWKAYRTGAGEVSIVFGPGAVNAPVAGTVIDHREGSPQFYERLERILRAEAEDPAIVDVSAVQWYCEAHSQAPVRVGSQLKGYAGMRCYGSGIPRGRIAWQFDRKALIGWSMYSDEVRYTAWQSGGTQGTDIYARCKTTDGRSRAYTTKMRPEFEGLGWVGNWDRSNSLSNTPCGYKEW